MEGYTISTDQQQLDVDLIHQFIASVDLRRLNEC